MQKVVLLTGAAGGIGTGLVNALSDAGWAVLGSDHPKATPHQSTLEQCHAWIPADLLALSQDSECLDAFVSQVCSATGGTDITAIIHNAALQRLGSFHQLSTSDWNQTIAVNLMAPIHINRAFVAQLRRQKGSILHIGSIHSQLTKPGFTAYATSKAALAGLTRAMAVELGDFVRVNAIEPAAIATPMLEAGFADNPELRGQLESFHPTRSIGCPSDVANAALFLLDQSNKFLNGCVLPLGGGIHSRLHDPD